MSFKNKKLLNIIQEFFIFNRIYLISNNYDYSLSIIWLNNFENYNISIYIVNDFITHKKKIMKKLVLFSLLLVATIVTTVACKKSECFTCKYLGITYFETCRSDFSTDAEYQAYIDANRTSFNGLWVCK